MSHNIHHYEYPENCNKKAVEREIDAYVKRQTYEEGGHGLNSPIRWIDDHIYDGPEQAREAIESLDRGWYDQLAVKYRQLPNAISNKKLDDLRRKASETYKTLSALDREIAVKGFKAQLVTCKKCGSKLNKDYLNSNYCPLCRADMRADTTQKRLAALRKKYKELQGAIRKEEEALATKKGRVMWMIKIEYHT